MNSTEKQDNKFLIGYMVNPTLNVNKVFRYQVEKFLTYIFHRSTMSGIRNDIKNYSCVIALLIFMRIEQPLQ